MTRPEPDAEQSVFINEPAAQVVLAGGPRCGKSVALALRAAHRGLPVVWLGADAEAQWCPRGTRVTTLSRLVTEFFMTGHCGLRSGDYEPADHEEVKRLFMLANADLLPAEIGPWLAAFLSLKRGHTGRHRSSAIGAVMRFGLSLDGVSPVDALIAACERTEVLLAQAHLRWGHDYLDVLLAELSNRTDLGRALFAGAGALCVDDAQLLSTTELRLILALARAGVATWVTIGEHQCYGLRDGAAALLTQTRLAEAGFSGLRCGTDSRMSPDQARSVLAALGIDRRPPFTGTGGGTFSTQILFHEETEAAYDHLVEELRADLAGGDQGDAPTVAVLTPLPEMARSVARTLAGAGLPVVERGRRAGENSAGFLVCIAAARLIRGDLASVALRQVGYLWIESTEQWGEVVDQRPASLLQVLDMVEGGACQSDVADLVAWLQAMRDKPPADLVAEIRGAPFWPGDPTNEQGLLRFTQCLTNLRITAWDDPAWASIQALVGQDVDGRPEQPGLSVLGIADTRGLTWDRVHLFGFNEGLIPGPSTQAERTRESHVLVQAITRARAKITFHYVAMLQMSPGEEEVKYRLSSFATRMGLASDTPSGVAPTARFAKTQRMRPG